MTELSVNIQKLIEAPIKKVFDAWLDPVMLAQFMLPAPGMEPSPTKNEARVDGRFEILMNVGDKQIPHTGTYLEIDRPSTLVFTWESPASLDNSIVTLKFTAVDDNKTNIVLTHDRFIDEEHRSNHEGGWTNILKSLNQVMR